MKLENLEAKQMRRSKLEINIDILKVLARTGPLRLTHMAHESNINVSTLKGYLVFLIKQGLVEERTIKKSSVVFTVTKRGVTVLKFFGGPQQKISVIEKA